MDSQILRAEAELDHALTARRPPDDGPQDITYTVITGMEGLRSAGLLAGARAMASRIYQTQTWWHHAGRPRAASLFPTPRGEEHNTYFIVARAAPNHAGDHIPTEPPTQDPSLLLMVINLHKCSFILGMDPISGLFISDILPDISLIIRHTGFLCPDIRYPA